MEFSQQDVAWSRWLCEAAPVGSRTHTDRSKNPPENRELADFTSDAQDAGAGPALINEANQNKAAALNLP